MLVVTALTCETGEPFSVPIPWKLRRGSSALALARTLAIFVTGLVLALPRLFLSILLPTPEWSQLRDEAMAHPDESSAKLVLVLFLFFGELTFELGFMAPLLVLRAPLLTAGGLRCGALIELLL